MKRLQNKFIGVEQGDVVLFSDFEDGGEMWSGEGTRERRQGITFSERFSGAPAVHVGLTLYDMDSSRNLRADVSADNITETGFELVFLTWADSRVARVRIGWTAIGQLPNEDDWDLDVP